MEPILLKVTDIMKKLGISRNTAYRLVHRPEFPAFRIGPRMIRISRQGFERWVDEHYNK